MDNAVLLNLTGDIVSAHVSNNSVSVSDVAGLVQRVHAALSGLIAPEAEAAAAPEAKKSVVSVRASIKPDYLICMECGKKQKTLKRHLATAHNMTPAQYRVDFGLPHDYPMTSPNYSQKRGDMARSIGLGRKPEVPAEQVAEEPGGRARKRLKLDIAEPSSDDPSNVGVDQDDNDRTSDG